MFPPVTPHLNVHGLVIQATPEKGRGVFATRRIEAGTLIEIAPVLLFEMKEYEEHGRFTLLDHYTFKWRDGRMALPLGLGSLFNHSPSPNVTYTKRKDLQCIEYRAVKSIDANEELLIFYGHKLWFEVKGVESSNGITVTADDDDELPDAWSELRGMDIV